MCAQYLFDDEVKEGAHGAFTPAMMQLSQVTWIETFLEGVTDKITGDPIFNELAWFGYKVSGVMCSASECEHSWSIKGWIYSKLEGGIDSVRSWLRGSFAHTQTWC
jgi:hypothetical protein